MIVIRVIITITTITIINNITTIRIVTIIVVITTILINYIRRFCAFVPQDDALARVRMLLKDTWQLWHVMPVRYADSWDSWQYLYIIIVYMYRCTYVYVCMYIYIHTHIEVGHWVRDWMQGSRVLAAI